MSSTWPAPPASAIHGDHEDDLSIPPWPTEPTTHWSEPDLPETSRWGSDASAGWNPVPSTFDRISLTKDVVPEFKPPFSVKSTLQEERGDDGTALTALHSSPVVTPEENTPPSPLPVEPLNPPADSPKPPPLALPTIEDADGFGAPNASVSDDWTTASMLNFSLPSAKRTDVDDAWDTARQQKEKHVPNHVAAPGTVANLIFLQLEEISNDLQKDAEAASSGELENQRNSNFDSLCLTNVPDDLTLPMSQPFSKTFPLKQPSDALKLTACTLTHPFATFMMSKGSTSWEAAIKARLNITQDSITPAGWKIVESGKQTAMPVDNRKRKTGGGLLSFFGRRATTLSAGPSRCSASSGSASVKAGTSPRASIGSSHLNPLPYHLPCSATLNWDQDPRLFELSHALKALGLTQP
ncbi:unnamed protein product [Cyclocybe aegerita]|uniref:Uncharacterized protein n=1 Tax=Cyclocybe aegerita TaxID=1973307 RepID=A0A8S0WUF1_CYCAE|nr:unnamed protein product [Cyclocybe aegerita]